MIAENIEKGKVKKQSNGNQKKEERKMRKLIVMAIAVLMILGVSTLSYADVMSTDKAVSVLLGVNTVFGFEIDDPELSQTLDAVVSGGSSSGSVSMYVSSNHSIPWTISANSTGVIGETQVAPDTLPIIMTTYTGTGQGTIVTDLELTALDQAIYTSLGTDYPCAGLVIGGTFVVNTLATTKEDLYSGSIALTMTE